jgi:hypothetical protein
MRLRWLGLGSRTVLTRSAALGMRHPAKAAIASRIASAVPGAPPGAKNGGTSVKAAQAARGWQMAQCLSYIAGVSLEDSNWQAWRGSISRQRDRGRSSIRIKTLLNLS